MDRPNFKNKNGVYLIKELFYETATNKDNVLFTLKTEEYNGYPSLYRLYLEADDVTEYRFATEHLGGWEHWEIMAESPFLKPYVIKWRRELEIKQKSEALAKIVSTSKSSTKEAFQAAKYVADNWNGPSPKRGRPSKDEIKMRTNEILSDKRRVEEDFARLTALQ